MTAITAENLKNLYIRQQSTAAYGGSKSNLSKTLTQGQWEQRHGSGVMASAIPVTSPS